MGMLNPGARIQRHQAFEQFVDGQVAATVFRTAEGGPLAQPNAGIMPSIFRPDPNLLSSYSVQTSFEGRARVLAEHHEAPDGLSLRRMPSVGYDIHTNRLVEWNVGCERCHGPGSEHAKNPPTHIVNPARLDYVHANDVCIQCHFQGRPLQNPIEGKYYDWPVGFQAGLNLQDYWKLETRKLGESDFYYFPDGTAHKNRMQGNDFTMGLMYRRSVRCFSCHDVHGTDNAYQLLKPANVICLECHGPGSPNGPHTGKIEEHTHHMVGSPGSDCVSCHMPAIEATIDDVKVHSHTFEFITPAMTDRYRIPNP